VNIVTFEALRSTMVPTTTIVTPGDSYVTAAANRVPETARNCNNY